MRAIVLFAVALWGSVAAQTPAPWPTDAIRAMDAARAAAMGEKARLEPLKRSEPARYAAEYRAALGRWEQALQPYYATVTQSVGARQEVMNEYMQLGRYLRFDAGRIDDAIAAYEGAQRTTPPNYGDMAAIALADIQRFAKRDPAGALGQYRRAIASLQSANMSESERVMAAAFRHWIEQEVAFIERGQRFAGAVNRRDAGLAQFWVMTGGMPEPAPRVMDRGVLERLPASEFQIARYFAAVMELEPQAMLAFFAKHDPAGYLTAATFAYALYVQPSPYVKAAADTFFASRGIRSPGTTPDARYASPEKTWAAFIGAARKGDAEAMLDCFTPTMQARLGELFTRMSAAERRAMAESFVGFAVQDSTAPDIREAAAARQVKDKRMAAFITFINDGGAWKIDSM